MIPLIQLTFYFFFDRDYEIDLSEISDSKSYVTECYSIENYYTSETSVRNCISAMFFNDIIETDDDNEELEKIVENYINIQINFHNSISLFNFWAWSQRHFPKSGSLDLDLFRVSDYISVHVDTETATAQYSLSDLNALCPTRDPVSDTEIAEAAMWFTPRKYQLSFRGKQECELLYIYLKKLEEFGSQAKYPFTRKHKLRKHVSKKNFIADLSAYADTPLSLTNFLLHHIEKWKENLPQALPEP